MDEAKFSFDEECPSRSSSTRNFARQLPGKEVYGLTIVLHFLFTLQLEFAFDLLHLCPTNTSVTMRLPLLKRVCLLQKRED